MKTLVRSIALFVGVVFFTGGACPSNDTTPSNKVAQTEIYQSYSVTQDGANYDVTAYFRVGGRTGTTLALSAPSNVTFNGRKMEEHLNTSSGTYYTTVVPANTPNGSFVFTDRNGRSYTNNIDLSRVSPDTKRLMVNGAAPVSIALSGTPPGTASFNLQLNNRMVFVDMEQGETTEAFFDRQRSAINVMPAAWKDIPNGSVTLDLEVRNTVSTQQGTALGGEMAFTYETAQLQATLNKAKAKTGKTSAAKPAVKKNAAGK